MKENKRGRMQKSAMEIPIFKNRLFLQQMRPKEDEYDTKFFLPES